MDKSVDSVQILGTQVLQVLWYEFVFHLWRQ